MDSSDLVTETRGYIRPIPPFFVLKAPSSQAAENKKKDELDEESLDPNVRGSYFRFFIHNLIIFFH